MKSFWGMLIVGGILILGGMALGFSQSSPLPDAKRRLATLAAKVIGLFAGLSTVWALVYFSVKFREVPFWVGEVLVAGACFIMGIRLFTYNTVSTKASDQQSALQSPLRAFINSLLFCALLVVVTMIVWYAYHFFH